MGTTSVYSLPYPGNNDPATVPADIQELAQAVEAILQGNLTLGANLTVPGTLTANGGLVVAGVGQRLFARKTADEPLTGSTTFQADNHLVFTLAANAVYTIDGALFLGTGNSAGDFNCRFSWTNTATLHYMGPGMHNAPTTSGGDGEWISRQNQTTSPSQNIPFGIPSSLSSGALINGEIETGGSTVTLTFEWAQLAASGTTTLLKGSWMRLTREV